MKFTKNNENQCETGVPVSGAFKLDRLQNVKLIFPQKFSTFLPFILGGPIFYYPRERKAEYEKREFSKNGCEIGVPVPGAFKLDHLQTVKLIFFL